jgi:hypothetical protein
MRPPPGKSICLGVEKAREFITQIARQQEKTEQYPRFSCQG